VSLPKSKNVKHLPRQSLPKAIVVNIVRVFEPNPPKGDKPIEWFLVTSEPIATSEEVKKVVESYRSRWTIEEFFKALKTGCKIEQRLFGTASAWFSLLGLFIPIACFLCNLRCIAETTPEQEPRVLFNEIQLEILCRLAEQEGRQITTIQDAQLELARLGGQIKYSGPPGWLVLARGMEELILMEKGWNVAIQSNLLSPIQYVIKSET
jgi:hypothetical protein